MPHTLSKLLLLALLLTAPISAITENTTINTALTIYEQPRFYTLKQDSLQLPNNTDLFLPAWENRLYALATFSYTAAEKWRFHTQARPTITTTTLATNITLHIDESYIEIPYENAFVFIGRKNIRDGVAFSTNPTDFFGENKTVDTSKRAEDRRQERLGDNVLGAELLLDNSTYSLILSPETLSSTPRYYAKAAYQLNDLNTDLSLHFFGTPVTDFTPSGIGLNISTTLGDALVLYSETANRWDSFGNNALNTVIGGHLTFPDSTNLIIEYNHNGSGYTPAQWNLIRTTPGILPVGHLRQDYAFIRYSHPNVGPTLQAALVYLQNLNDGSAVFNPYLEAHPTDTLTLLLSTYIFISSESTEFAKIPWTPEITFTAKWFWI